MSLFLAVPEPVVQWYYNNQVIKPSKYFQMYSSNGTYTLTLAGAFPEDEGIYKCTARNQAGEVTCIAHLKVNCKQSFHNLFQSKLISCFLCEYLGFNTLRPRQNGHHFADIFKCIFFNEDSWILLKISLKVIPKVRINNIPALAGAKPLSEPTMVSLLTHICVTRLQWVNAQSTECIILLSMTLIRVLPQNNVWYQDCRELWYLHVLCCILSFYLLNCVNFVKSGQKFWYWPCRI